MSADLDDHKLCTCCVSRTSRIVECVRCNYRACVKCISHFLTTQVVDAACMSCHTTYTPEWMVENFTQEFLRKVWPAHRKRILFELEKAMLPQTMPYLAEVRGLEQWRDERDEVERLLNELTAVKEALERKIARAEALLNGEARFRNQREEKNEEKNVEDERAPLACPVNECRGYLTDRGKCGVCEVECCRECREIKRPDADHVCDPNTIATVKALQKECRRCPKCSVYIFRIDGCDQMWCVQCHTAFDWKTGRIVQGRVHNPHYFQYLREHAPEQLQRDANAANTANAAQGCHADRIHQEAQLVLGRFAQHFPEQAVACVKKIKPFVVGIRQQDLYISTMPSNLSYAFRLLTSVVDHLRDVLLDRVPHQIDPNVNMDIRLKYLLGQIDQAELEKTVLRRQKNLEKQLQYREIVETFLQLYEEASVQLSRSLIHDRNPEVERLLDQFLSNVNQVRQFTNTALTKLDTVHGGRKSRKIPE